MSDQVFGKSNPGTVDRSREPGEQNSHSYDDI